MLLAAPTPTVEPIALLADFVDRHYFTQRGRGRPKSGGAKPWTVAQTTQLARELMKNRSPTGWRIDLAKQLLLFRLANSRKNRRPPIYQRTQRDAQLLLAAAETSSVRKERGLKVERAVELVAPLHDLTETTLINDMEGRRGSRRKARDKK